MEITLTVNGKQVKATVDEQEMKKAMAVRPRKKTGYEKNFDIIAYIVDRDGEAKSYNAVNHLISTTEPIYNTGNYYTVESVAENNARADSLMRNLRRFAAEHGGCTSGKRGGIGESAHIILCHDDKIVATDVVKNQAGAIDFCSKEAAEEAIKEFYTELEWYFNEYDPMPEGWWDS